MIKCKPLALVGLLAITGCGGPKPDPHPSSSPTGYSIGKADLWAETPRDTCRSLDKGFLSALLDQVKEKLPIEQRSTVEFRDFSVPDAVDGQPREAILRFDVVKSGGAKILMYAVGAFNLDNCEIGGVRVGEGASPYASRLP